MPTSAAAGTASDVAVTALEPSSFVAPFPAVPATAARRAQPTRDLTFGAALRTPAGDRLGRLEVIGLDEVGRIAAVGSGRWLYPAAGLRSVEPGGAVVVDPNVVGAVRVAWQLTRRTRCWTADDVEVVPAGLRMNADDLHATALLVRARRSRTPTVIRWSLVFPEREGVALRMRWATRDSVVGPT